MNEETARTVIRVREAEKSHGIRTFSPGRGAKKKDPNCIQIRVLLWRRGWDSNPRDVSAKLISSLLCNCDGGVRFGVVSVSPVPAESRLKSGFFAWKALRGRLF